MGEWPTDVAQLSDVATITSGKRPLVVSKERTTELQIPVIGGGGQSGYTDRPLLRDKALITGRVGTLGKLHAIVEPCWPSDNALVVAPKTAATDWSYLRYALELKIADAANMNRGAANPLITQKDLGTLKIFHPDLSVQRAIADVLSALDDKIELNREMNETLEASARALYRDWFVDFGPTRAKMEGRPAYLAPELWSLFPDRLDDDGKPEGWEIKPVSSFAELRGGKQLEKSQIFDRGEIPVFGGAGVMGFAMHHNADGYVISVGRVGAYCGQFFSHRGKAWINNNASLIRVFEAERAEWLFLALKQLDIENIKKGAAQPFVSNSDVSNLPIVWPGNLVVEAFTRLIVPFVLKMERNESESRTLAETRDLLLPKLMSGKIRVRDAEGLAAIL